MKTTKQAPLQIKTGVRAGTRHDTIKNSIGNIR
ncbi:hypothetical protein NAEX_03821 [Nannocystis exedens]|nr:hypothetical protein NAEX_03821 [Nannocystis exedens]